MSLVISEIAQRLLARRLRPDHGAAPAVAHALARGEPLATVAYDSGYADQPHFNRDFHNLVGCPPGEFPFLQDVLAAA